MSEDLMAMRAALRDALRRGYRLALAMLGATGFALETYVVLAKGDGTPPLLSMVRLLSYFTIQSTLAATVWSGVRAFRRRNADGTPAPPRRSDPALSLAVLSASLVTGVVYYAFLSPLWKPSGLALLADVLVHAVVPAMVLVDWIVFEPRGDLRARAIAAVLPLPLFSLAYSLVLGGATGKYDYYFADPVALGVPAFLLNVLLLAAAFAAVGALGWLADRALRPRRKEPSSS